MQKLKLAETQKERKERMEKQELKKLDFNKTEYEYFINNCCFTERQLDILALKRKGKSHIEISLKLFISEATVKRELKEIRRKILKEI